MKTVYKYLLKITDEQSLQMPIGAGILHVAIDPQGDLALWALVDTSQPSQTRRFAVFGTGNPVDGPLEQHIGTVVIGRGVWHIFERPTI